MTARQCYNATVHWRKRAILLTQSRSGGMVDAPVSKTGGIISRVSSSLTFGTTPSIQATAILKNSSKWPEVSAIAVLCGHNVGQNHFALHRHSGFYAANLALLKRLSVCDSRHSAVFPGSSTCLQPRYTPLFAIGQKPFLPRTSKRKGAPSRRALGQRIWWRQPRPLNQSATRPGGYRPEPTDRAPHPEADISWPHHRRPPKHQVRIQRMSHAGMLVQVVGSFHCWLGVDGAQFTLFLGVDDATSAVVNAVLGPEEDTRG